MPKRKAASLKTSRALNFWYGVTTAALDQLPYDLSARQIAILLHIYLMPSPHSIKSLSKLLAISKAATCRAVDVLENARLVRRAADRRDGRNVLIQRTVKGSGYLGDFSDILLRHSKEKAFGR